MKKIMFLGLCALFTFANTIKDSDLDGVPNNLDLCPNTPFLAPVNKYGCSAQQWKKLMAKKKKKNKINFNINLGYEHDHYKSSKSSNLYFTSIYARKNNLRISLYYSMLNDGYENGYKSNDLITSLNYYYYNIPNVALKLEAKVYFPTYFNDKTDYAFLIQGTYFFKNFDIGASEKHKIYGESGTNDTDTITFFADFPYKKFVFSPYYYTENDSYDSSKWYHYGGITLFYAFNNKIGVMLDSYMDLDENENYTIDGSLSYNF